MARKSTEKNCEGSCCCGSQSKVFWGIGILVIGLFFLASDLGYIAGISWWTILFVVFGLLLLVKKR